MKINIAEEANLQKKLRKTDETRSYILDELKHNDLMSEKYKKTYKYQNYVEHLFIIASAITGCVSISAFASIVCVPVEITSSTIGIKICIYIYIYIYICIYIYMWYFCIIFIKKSAQYKER